MGDTVRIGVLGTSWWADAMYLPALMKHPQADVRGVVGSSRPAHTREFAKHWGIPDAFDSLDQMLGETSLDALLVLTPNREHHPLVMTGIEHGLHILCEKPLATSSGLAREMSEAAERAGVTTMVPFTYRFMPTSRHIKELIDEGYIGRPYHLNMRYYTGYGRSGAYAWRFDVGEAGSGVAGDLGSHWVYLARWYFGEVAAVTALLTHVVPRQPRPDGAPFEAGEDAAMILLEFVNGASGSLHVTSLAHEPGPFGQRHEMDFHGSAGSLHVLNDWITTQRVVGSREGEQEMRELPIPDALFGDARRDTVHNTYKDVFREQDNMTRGFVTAVARREKASPDFADGLAVQRVLDAVSRSGREGRRVAIEEIVSEGG